MANILIVKHGEQGDAQRLSEEIMKTWPDARVQIANPNEAHIFLRKEKWDDPAKQHQQMYSQIQPLVHLH